MHTCTESQYTRGPLTYFYAVSVSCYCISYVFHAVVRISMHQSLRRKKTYRFIMPLKKQSVAQGIILQSLGWPEIRWAWSNLLYQPNHVKYRGIIFAEKYIHYSHTSMHKWSFFFLFKKRKARASWLVRQESMGRITKNCPKIKKKNKQV